MMYDEIYSDLRKLISQSCDFKESPSARFQEFHKEFLKLYFGVLDVQIDYEKKSIVLWSPKPIKSDVFDLHNLNESMQEKVYYDDLESTLLGCIEEGDFQARFYRHFLLEYGKDKSFFDRISNFKTA